MSNVETVTWLARIFSLGLAAWLVAFVFTFTFGLMEIFLPGPYYAVTLTPWFIVKTPFLYGTTMGFIALVGIFLLWEWELLKCLEYSDGPVAGQRASHSHRDVLWLLCPVANLFKPFPVIRWAMTRAGLTRNPWLAAAWWVAVVLVFLDSWFYAVIYFLFVSGVDNWGQVSLSLLSSQIETLSLLIRGMGGLLTLAIVRMTTRALNRTPVVRSN